MANLPANNDMTGTGVTQGGFRARLDDVLTFLRDILGSTGTPAAARTALGLGALATKSDVAASDIATGAVTADKIGAGAVTEPKIGAGAVTGAKIADGAVGTAKIAAGAVSDALLAANAVTEAKLAAGAVTAGKIADGAVSAAKLAANAVGTAAIADGAVTLAKLAGTAISVSVVAQADIASPVAQVDLTLPSSIAIFALEIADLRPSALSSSLRMRVSSDGVTFATGGTDYRDGDFSSSYMQIGSGLQPDEDHSHMGRWLIYPGAPTTPRLMVFGTLASISSSGGIQASSVGVRSAAGRQQAIRLYMSSGNINRATIRLIGVA